MSLIFADSFEYTSQFPKSKKLDKNWWKKKTTLASILRINSERAARENDNRAGLNYISEEGAFTVEPIPGNPWGWIITVKSRPLNPDDPNNENYEIKWND